MMTKAGRDGHVSGQRNKMNIFRDLKAWYSGLKFASKMIYKSIMLAAAIAGVLTYFNLVISPEEPEAPVVEVSQNPTADEAGGEPLKGAESQEREPTCFTEKNGVLNPAACDSLHTHEIFSPDAPCTLDKLIGFLGGDPVVDTASSELVLSTAEKGSCLVSVRSGESIATSFEKGMTGENHAFYRQCVDAVLGNKEVGCHRRHTGEVIKSVPRSSTIEMNCEDAAEKYIGRKMRNLNSDLEIGIGRGSAASARTCVASVRGSNILNGSLRNLNFKSMPVEPDDGIRE